MSGPEIGGGTVEVILDGKPMMLVPSLEACVEISRMSGGINGAVQRIQMLNFETICYIIGVGLEIDGKRLNPGQRDKMVPKAVYEAGLVGISAACLRFCNIIAHGGREPEDDEEEEDDKEGDDAPLE